MLSYIFLLMFPTVTTIVCVDCFCLFAFFFVFIPFLQWVRPYLLINFIFGRWTDLQEVLRTFILLGPKMADHMENDISPRQIQASELG